MQVGQSATLCCNVCYSVFVEPNTDEHSISQVFNFRTPGIQAFVALLLKDHAAERVQHTERGWYVRCACTPQVFRTDAEHRDHAAAIIVQKLDDIYHREIDAPQD